MKTAHSLSLFALLCACASTRWRPANPDDPDRTECCIGTITRLELEPGRDAVIHLDPVPASRRLLAPGQEELVCEVYGSRRDTFDDIFKLLNLGMVVEICGYWVVDREAGSIHKLRPVTSIDPLPDSTSGR
jgi:hypothetical protein